MCRSPYTTLPETNEPQPKAKKKTTNQIHILVGKVYLPPQFVAKEQQRPCWSPKFIEFYNSEDRDNIFLPSLISDRIYEN